MVASCALCALLAVRMQPLPLKVPLAPLFRNRFSTMQHVLPVFSPASIWFLSLSVPLWMENMKGATKGQVFALLKRHYAFYPPSLIKPNIVYNALPQVAKKNNAKALRIQRWSEYIPFVVNEGDHCRNGCAFCLRSMEQESFGGSKIIILFENYWDMLMLPYPLDARMYAKI